MREVMAMQSEHLSSYEVIYEDDTPLFHQLQAGQFSVDEDLACQMYEELVECAMTTGFLLIAQTNNLTFYLLPLAMVVSLVYSASRFELPDRILSRAIWLFIQIIGFMAAVFGVLWLLSFGI